MEEKGRLIGKWTVHKFSDRAHYDRQEPYDVGSFHNVLLNEGITRALNLIVAGGGTAYSSANAWLGVGDSTASSGVATSTGLLSTTNRLYIAVSSVTVASQTATWRAVFSSVQANFNWREFSLKNSTGSTSNSGDSLNRAVSNQGTKASGQVWTADLQITLS